MYKLLLCLLLMGSFAFAQERQMSSTEKEAFAQQVIALSQRIQTIQSDFIQLKHLDFLTNEIKTEGKMAFKMPNLVRWEYTQPYQYCIIFKDHTLLINDGGTKSKMDMGNNKLFKNLNELIIQSVKGNMFGNEDFHITYFVASTYNKAIFKPKDAKVSEYIATFELLFNKEDAQVYEVKMVEPSGDYTKIIFKNRVINNPLNDSVFSY